MLRVLAAALIVATLPLVGRERSQQPTFRTGVNVVEVDVVVLDPSGVPVRGLGQQDFDVREDGKPVEVASFSAVDVPAAPPGAPVPPPDASGSATATNAQADDGRVVLVVFDDYHISFDAGRAAMARAAARRLIERLGPSDLAAIVATSGAAAMQVEFTSDKARLLAAADKFFPQSEVGASGVAERRSLASSAVPGRFGSSQEIKTRWAMEALSNAAKALALIPHRRKAVLLVSQGVPISLEEIITNPNAGGAWHHMREFILTAQRSNVAVYPVDPCGLTEDPGCSRDTREHLRSIAEGTGGFAVLNTNAPERGVDRMVAENGTYYLIAYYSPAPPADGKRHRIAVRVGRPGVQVRARESYVSARGGAAPEKRPLLDVLIGAPIQTRGLPMRVAAVPAPLGGRPGSTIVVSIELRADDALRAGELAFSVVALDDQGQVRARQHFASGFKGETPGPQFVTRLGARLDVPPGRYQVRVAAAGPKGMQGSVFTEVEVPKFDKPVSLGGLSLATSSAPAPASAERLGGVLPSIPIARRELPAPAELIALVPVRTTPRTKGQVTIRTTLVGPEGESSEVDRTTSAASEYAGGGGKVHRVRLKEALPPGEYRLVVDAAAGNHEAKRELMFRLLAPGTRIAP